MPTRFNTLSEAVAMARARALYFYTTVNIRWDADSKVYEVGTEYAKHALIAWVNRVGQLVVERD